MLVPMVTCITIVILVTSTAEQLFNKLYGVTLMTSLNWIEASMKSKQNFITRTIFVYFHFLSRDFFRGILSSNFIPIQLITPALERGIWVPSKTTRSAFHLGEFPTRPEFICTCWIFCCFLMLCKSRIFSMFRCVSIRYFLSTLRLREEGI